jgi:5-formyltetrahydrofolate cyclo-ligase
MADMLQKAKAEVRMRLLDKRALMSAEQREAASAAIVARITACDCFRQADSFCSFAPLREEVQVQALALQAVAQGCRIYFPAFDEASRRYRFRAWQADQPLVPGRWNIPEPAGDAFALPAGSVCVIVPGLAFDQQGMRVGYGGGYFDRMLRDVRDVSAKRVTAVGVGYAFQLLDEVPYGAHDEPLDFVVTEKEILTVNKRET